MACDVAEYKLQINTDRTTVDVEVVEVRIERAYGVEWWGVGVGRNGRLLDYFEYARQRDQIKTLTNPIPPSAPMCSPMPKVVKDAILDELRRVATIRYAIECAM